MPLTTAKENSSARWPNFVAILAGISTAPRWLPILVGVGISTATLFVWQALIAQERTHIEQMIQSESSNVNNVVAAQLKTQTAALKRMAKRWEIRGGTPKQEWESDAQSYVSDYGGYQAIEWVDPSFHVRWIVPRTGNEAAQNLNVARESRRRIALEAARDRHEVTITRSINLVQGGNGFLVYVPIFQGKDFRGFIVGVFRGRQLLDTLLKGQENVVRGYELSVFDGNEEIYSPNLVSRQHEQEWGQEKTINLYGVTWRVRIWPTPELLAKAQSPLPQVVLNGGLLMAWLLALAVHLTQKTRLQQQQAEVTNLELEQEIASRQRTETALLESEERFKAFMNNSPVVAFMKDEAGRYVYVNEQLERVFNIKQTDLQGKTDFDWLPEATAKQLRKDDQVVLAGDKTVELLESVSTPDGCPHYWMTLKFPIKDVSGQRLLGGVAIDITQRQQADEELREMSVALENAVEGIARLDAQGHYINVNKAYASFVGYKPEEMLGMEWQLTVHPEDRAQMIAAYRDMLKLGKVEAEARAVRKDGSVFYKQVTMVSAYNQKRQFTGHYCFMRDVTERKILELAQARLLEQEKQHSEELTIKNFALEQAKREAEAANRAKSEFLAMMSHEIRTPMNGVIGMTGLLLSTVITPQQQDFVETIRSSGEALLTIINDILDFSKIESGRLELEEHPFDLLSCVESALDLVAPAAAAKNLNLAYLLDPETLPVIVGDVTRVRQILVNLLGNAVKFTEAGEVVVSVKAKQVHPESYELEFSVKDTGIGISQERMERLFKPFSQGDASMTRRYGGTGLGLAISKRLSEMMGGRMWAESSVGQGSTFYFTVRALAPNLAVVAPQVPQPDLAGLRLLVVDDNTTNRQFLTLQAEAWGMQVRAAESGSQALGWICQGEKFDIAVLDMQMPYIDGLSLAAHIHSLPGCQELPLVMLSCVNRPMQQELGQTDDFVACLSKPIKRSQLYNVFVDIFSKQSLCVRSAQSSLLQFESPLAEHLPLRILLVEDVALNQKVAVQMLQKLGYRADVASNGLEALQALCRQDYDVVFMDVQMPQMDGLEAARRICQQWSFESRPWIIAMTAHAMLGDREDCLSAGMNDYISKPIRKEALVQALNNYRQLRMRAQGVKRAGGAGGAGGAEGAQGVEGAQGDGSGTLLSMCTLADSNPPTTPTPPTPPTPPIDPQVLQDLRDMAGDDAAYLVAEVISSYLEDAPLRLQDITAAVAYTDAFALQKSAHAFRSLSVTVGGISVAQLCYTLEAMGRTGTTAGAETLVKQLQAEYERLKAALQLEHPGSKS